MQMQESRRERWRTVARHARLLAVALLALVPATGAQAQTPPAAQRFLFSPIRPQADALTITPDMRAAAGQAGFEAVAPPAAGTRGFVTGSTPFLFSLPVAEGNWRVTVTLGDPAGTSNTTVKAESRRLMLSNVRTARGRTETRSFVVNVRNDRLTPPPLNAPGGDRVRLNDRETGSYTWDDKLTLEFAGPAPKLVALQVEPADVPTIYLAGDSTVTDQRAESGASWGQMLTAFMSDRVAVANHAESGETLKSFTTGLRLDKLLSAMKPGDLFLMQFGHNDQKEAWPQTYVAADSTYPAYLRAFVAEARRRGATPVLVSSPERRNWQDGAPTRIRPTLNTYVEAMRTLAAAENIPFIDLNAASIRLYEALGPDRAPLAFAGEGGRDITHHNNYGAWLLARIVADGLKQPSIALRPGLLAEGLAPFANPPTPEALAIAPSAARSTVAPRGN